MNDNGMPDDSDLDMMALDRAERDERFDAKVVLPENPDWCWEWTAYKLRGYGQFRLDGTMVLAHRYSYERFIGPIPAGLQLDHLCRNPSCVNPAHLEPVTGRENTLRGDTIPARHAAKTHCVNSHPFTPENTYHPPTKPNWRSCRACKRTRDRADRARVSND